MSTLRDNLCFICLANVGRKSKQTFSSADLTLKKKVCGQFHKFLSTFINLKINLADFKNLHNNKRQLQNNLCCEDCFVSVEKFCETFESYQCLQMELLQILDMFSNRMKTRIKANAPTLFQKDFIWKVYQKTNSDSTTTTIMDDQQVKTTPELTPSTSASSSAALIDQIECDDDDDFNMNSDCDEFPLILDNDSGECDTEVQEKDPLEDDEDIIEEALELEPPPIQEVSTPMNKAESTRVDIEDNGESQRKKSKRGGNRAKPPKYGKDKDYGLTSVSKTGRQLYHCPLCTQTSIKRCRFLLHLRLHAHEKVYHCQVCQLEFQTRELLTIHQTRVHRVSTTGDEPLIICEICQEIFGHPRARNQHLISVHGAEKKFVCVECGQKFFTRDSLFSHQKIHLNKTERPFECDLCPGRYKLKKTLKSHKARVHSTEYKERQKQRAKTNICEVCGKGFIYRRPLLVHKAQVHGEKNEVDLNKIRKYRLNTKLNHKCTYENCGRAFGTRSSLNDHIATHTREKNFQCDHCGNSYMQRITLRKHIKYKHSETNVKRKKNFKCHYENCERAFYDRSALNDHIASHTGEKNYQCDHCGKSYAFMIGLKKHVLRHHPEEKEKKFLCGQCGKGFDLPRNLSLHESLAHRK